MIIFLLGQTLCYDYDPLLAQKVSYWAATVYYPREEILGGKCRYCTRFPLQELRVHENLRYMSQSLVGYYPELNLIVVAFRGTIDLQNWGQDFEITQVDYKPCQGCKVHRGFFENYMSLRGFVQASMSELSKLHPKAQFVVLGHSMGAAMALLAGLDIQKDYPVLGIYTLGQPRVGNKAFALYVGTSRPVFRMIHDRDLVPHIPTHDELLLFQYEHGPRQVLYDKNMTLGGYRVCRQVGEDPDCSNSLGNFTMAEHAANFYVIEQDGLQY